MVWSPLVVAAGWAPFQHGRWIWHVRWGWTWVDHAPWGFAPFHYGRWVMWGHRWVWTPGPRVARPAFAPALVTFTSPSVGVSVVIGPSRPPVAWVPLAPREPHRPWTVHRPPLFDQGHRLHRAEPPLTEPGHRPHRAESVTQPERRHTPGTAPIRTAPPMAHSEGRARETVVPRVERPDNAYRPDKEKGARADRSERLERSVPPDPAQGRGRSTTEHRPRDPRERAQML